MDYTNISHISFGRGSAGCNGDTILQLNIFSAISNIHFNVSLTVRVLKIKDDHLLVGQVNLKLDGSSTFDLNSY
jgi:hypothetical protein